MFQEKMEEKAEETCGKRHGWRRSWRAAPCQGRYGSEGLWPVGGLPTPAHEHRQCRKTVARGQLMLKQRSWQKQGAVGENRRKQVLAKGNHYYTAVTTSSTVCC